MSSRSTSKSAATVLEPIDDRTVEPIVALHEQARTTDPPTLTTETELSSVASDGRGSSATEPQSEPGTAVTEGSSQASESDETAELLAQQLEQLVSSVAAVEDLSRRAREVAKTDLAALRRAHRVPAAVHRSHGAAVRHSRPGTGG